MADLDLDWMSSDVRRTFDEGLRLYAEAIRDGAVLHLQDGAEAMQRASQLHILQQGQARSDPIDASI